MRTIRILGAVLLSAVFAQSAELTTKRALNLEVARQMAAAAEAEARKNKWNVVICVVDDGANLIYLQKMDETQIGSIEVAQEKAKSAVRFKRPTKALEDAVAGGRNVVLRLPGALPVEGGIPIMADGKVIGAIGVSGVLSTQDAQIAQAGIDALAKILK